MRVRYTAYHDIPSNMWDAMVREFEDGNETRIKQYCERHKLPFGDIRDAVQDVNSPDAYTRR